MRAIVTACLILAACRDEQNLGNMPTRQILTMSSTEQLQDLRLDDGYVYLLTNQTFDSQAVDVFRIPQGGGAVEMITETPGQQDGFGAVLAVDDTYVYTAFLPPMQQTMALMRAPKAGGVTEIIDDGVGGESVVAVDDAFLYTVVEDAGQTTLRGYPKAGGSLVAITSPVSITSNVVAHDKLLYYVDQNATLVSVPRIGGSPTEIELDANASQLVADADNLYFVQDTNTGGPFSTCTGVLTAVPFAGGSPRQLGTTAGCAEGLAIGSNELYVVDDHGNLAAYGLDGTSSPLVTELAQPQHLVAASDGSALYYALQDSIIRLGFDDN